MTDTLFRSLADARQAWEGFGPSDEDAPARCQTFARFVQDHAPHLSIETAADLRAEAAATAQVTAAFGTVVEVRGDREVVANGFGGTTTRRREASTAKPATDKQKTFIRNLLAERSPALVAAVRADLNAEREAGGVTFATADRSIKALLAIPKAQAPAEAPQAPAQPRKRPNQYAGKCHLCGRRVAEQEGLVSKNDEGKWAVEHVACPTAFPFPEGRYAVPAEDGTLRFYHLAEGRVMVQASSELHFITNDHEAERIVKAIAADPEGASRTYGREIGSCGRCGRVLTNDQSRAEGLGPVCAEKGWG